MFFLIFQEYKNTWLEKTFGHAVSQKSVAKNPRYHSFSQNLVGDAKVLPFELFHVLQEFVQSVFHRFRKLFLYLYLRQLSR